ncbi:cyclin-P3-1-like [Asparagus officinalis]|nr:cyclin-P3-1-like [Asparagus officinalis]
MRSLAVETESKDQWNYRFLGISESGKGDYEFPQVLSLLFSVLKKTIQKNESLPDSTTRKANDTIDHGLRSQELSIQSYTKRIFKYSNCSHSCFILAHVYIDRYLVQPGVHLSCLNVHR